MEKEGSRVEMSTVEPPVCEIPSTKNDQIEKKKQRPHEMHTVDLVLFGCWTSFATPLSRRETPRPRMMVNSTRTCRYISMLEHLPGGWRDLKEGYCKTATDLFANFLKLMLHFRTVFRHDSQSVVE
jgi:hypothetical protein